MTDQQTAATDNALVEKLEQRHVVPFKVAFGTLVNPNGPEAAERIKSLLAEVSDLKLDVATLNSGMRLQRRRLEQAEADRQRMRDALEWLRTQMQHEQSIGVSGFEDWITPIDAALNPASKEANDG